MKSLFFYRIHCKNLIWKQSFNFYVDFKILHHERWYIYWYKKMPWLSFYQIKFQNFIQKLPFNFYVDFEFEKFQDWVLLIFLRNIKFFEKMGRLCIYWWDKMKCFFFSIEYITETPKSSHWVFMFFQGWKIV